MGIPFCKFRGFPKLSPSYITDWEFPLQNVIAVEYCGPGRPFQKYFSDIFSSVKLCLYPKECNQLISKKLSTLELCASFPLSNKYIYILPHKVSELRRAIDLF